MIRITMNKSAFVLLIISCVFMLTTCQFRGCDKEKTNTAETSDTIFLNQWRREKSEKINLIKSYELRITGMQQTADGLRNQITENKQSISGLRFKVKYFEDQLRNTLGSTDSSRQGISFLDSLSIAQNGSDSACDETIHNLERLVCNRDSVIDAHRHMEQSFKEIQQRDLLNTEYLTQQLNDAVKRNRRKTRQNKFLAGGLLLLTGISTSLLVTQHLK